METWVDDMTAIMFGSSAVAWQATYTAQRRPSCCLVHRVQLVADSVPVRHGVGHVYGARAGVDHAVCVLHPGKAALDRVRRVC